MIAVGPKELRVCSGTSECQKTVSFASFSISNVCTGYMRHNGAWVVGSLRSLTLKALPCAVAPNGPFCRKATVDKFLTPAGGGKALL